MVTLFGVRSPAPASPPRPPASGHRPKNVVEIFGAGGMGKTLYLKAMVRGRINRAGRVLTIDPNGVFEGYGRVMGVRHALAALEASQGRPFAIVVQPLWDEELTDLFEACYTAGDLLLGVDEAADFGGRGRLDENLLRVAQKCRNKRVDLATTCLNVTDLDSRIRLNHSVGVCFQQPLPDAAVRFAIEFAHRNPKDLAPRLMALPRFHYLRATVGGGLERGTVPDPAIHGPP